MNRIQIEHIIRTASQISDDAEIVVVGSQAEARGQHMRRPPKLTSHQQKEARRQRAEGATLKELAKSYNVGRAMISRLVP